MDLSPGIVMGTMLGLFLPEATWDLKSSWGFLLAWGWGKGSSLATRALFLGPVGPGNPIESTVGIATSWPSAWPGPPTFLTVISPLHCTSQPCLEFPSLD